MRQVGRKLAVVVNSLSYITGAVGALSIVAAAFIVTEGVVARKVFGFSTIWQIEASVYLLIYACFVGAALAQMHEHHLNVDLVIIHLTPRIREITLLVVSIVSCIVCGIVAWYAWPMWWEAVVRNDHSESLWGPPLWIPYFFIPFGMSVLFLQYIVYITKKITVLKKGEVVDEAERFELKDIKMPPSDSDHSG